MSQLTKQQLQVENNISFPNNNTGYITPQALRGFNSDLIDSVVVNGGTGSFATTGSNSFNGDQTISGDLQMNNTGVVGTNYIETAGSQTLQINADTTTILGDLEVKGTISGSVEGIGNVTAFSASVDNRINNTIGAQGATGTQGASGTNGIDGAQGATGGTGAQGSTGAQGPGSAQGQVGLQGVQGYIGSQGTQGRTGVGTQGSQGTSGTQGPTGGQGSTGAGTQGSTGAQGGTGSQGAGGTQGATGAGTQGATGSQGGTGTQGAVGSQGAIGNTGGAGSQGIQGIQGLRGNTGSQGTQGTIGNTGAQGQVGLQGVQGYIGNQGTTGTQGSFGTQGNTGAGTQGIQGIQGTAGSTPNTASFATTGSNAFTGNQSFVANINGNNWRLNGGDLVTTNSDSIRFYSGSVTSSNGWINMQAVPTSPVPQMAISQFPENNHFIFFQSRNGSNEQRISIESPLSGEINNTIRTISNIETTGSITATNSLVANGNTYSLGQYANMYIMQNAQYSGSQYPGQTIIVAPNVYPTDIFGGLTIGTELGLAAGQTFLGVVANSYSPYYFGTTVPMIIANGNNPDGGDTAIIWAPDGHAEHYKISDFKFGINVTGSITIKSGSGDLYVHGHKQFNVGTFQSNITQSGSANVSQSVVLEETDISHGVSIVSGSRITIENSGVYNIQFSTQIDRVSGTGTDTIHIWLKKNGSNVPKSSGTATISGNATEAKTVTAWNYVVDAAANDYYELVWQTTDTNIQLINVAATGNIPSTPSVILTVTQVR